MKLSPIQLLGYALIDLSYRANQEHRPGEPVKYSDEDIAVGTRLERDNTAANRCGIVLTIKLQPRPAANGPYHLSLKLAGVIQFTPELQGPEKEVVLRVNASSVLYGVAREIIRQVTSLGPYQAILIPTVSFRPEAQPEEIAVNRRQ